MLNTLKVLLLILISTPLMPCVSHAKTIEAPIENMALAVTPSQATAVLAGGCFWGVQAVFQHVKGVTNVVAGYAGGSLERANYTAVSSGTTGHAEAVKITFDPSQISYGQLLQVYFSVAHDPTELNRQGPDQGTQYRSSVFYTNAEQQRVAQLYITQLERQGAFHRPIVTTNVPLQDFYVAESDHQNYFNKHPDSAYIIYNDAPKLVDLQQSYPELYQRTSI
ncbi:Peptide methionine sulfoxide reductase MsrA 3 [Ephemeroptericola cinctiostellae]|uniref:Peptide methionine sulfoxide reductase MsrA n=1 Tax=Ephemeroptericola cinctiostellae TaxID=2268024 RepID=A0A345DCN1_9BURK|nr:peptide-methionine (S)-S-oxide reductase MsrA [Ephemeroptericola cinctiostellae]AXF86119.1 Peptide methionine sulfoxide reductase MsrA 3 [Ephemeroptericola cinctiostellae]